MKLSGNSRLQTGAWGRFVLGMFVVAWLNIATQPCLMAMETAPDAPMAAEHAAHSGHVELQANTTDADDCSHCPADNGHQEALCSTASASGCEVFPGYSVDGRQLELKFKDISPPLSLIQIDDVLDFRRPVSVFLPPDTRRLKFAGDPPLNIRHCVFLK